MFNLLKEVSEQPMLIVQVARKGAAVTRYHHSLRLHELGFVHFTKCYGGNALTITQAGRTALAGRTFPASSAKVRIPRRRNGQFKEGVECDICFKRYWDESVSYNEDLGCAECAACADKREKNNP